MTNRAYFPRAIAIALQQQFPTPAYTLLATAALVLVSGAGNLRAADLPVPCAASICTGGGAAGWVADPTRASLAIVGRNMEITQRNNRELYNWAEFNIGAEHSVNFKQPGSDSVALNRIYQESPSQILGKLDSNGNVYLINPNGVLFGKDSQVNVRGLVASSLNISEAAIENGILAPELLQQNQPAFSSDGRVFVTDAAGNVVTDANGNPIPVKVVVEDGATIQANDDGGRIMLLGQQVENGGSISADRGQIILGAGEKVYLQASDDPELRGLLIEVDAGGEAWNRLTGELSSNLGNVTMAGLVVNQDGRASATTSVSANGSIRLLARDTAQIQVGIGGRIDLAATNAGTLRLGGTSITEILPDAVAGSAVDEQTQTPSRIEMQARNITLESGARVTARGGEVSLTALPDPRFVVPPGVDPLPNDTESSIEIQEGAVIDVAGASSTTSVARNVVEVELRSNELRDAPLQRDGILRGETVRVDISEGTPLADVSGAVATIERDVSERLGSGGTVVLDSQGSVNIAAGAKIDVSGGKLTYTPGEVSTTLLVTSSGQFIDIGDASPDNLYSAIIDPRTLGVRFRDPGYVEGFDAGTLRIAGRELAINGDFNGAVTIGDRQRLPGQAPLGGRLIIGDPDGQGLPANDFKAPSVTLTDSPIANLVPSAYLELSLDYLKSRGFTRTSIYSNGKIALTGSKELELTPGSELLLSGAAVDISRSVFAPGGKILLAADDLDNRVSLLDPQQRTGVTLADGVRLDVSGTLTNDLATATQPSVIAVNGGVIDIDVTAVNGELQLGKDVRLAADAGAWVARDGSVTTGAGGALRIAAGGAGVALETGSGLQLSAYGFDKGGSLELAANQLRVAGTGPLFGKLQRQDPLTDASLPYSISSRLFDTGGFASVSLVATGATLNTAAGLLDPLTIASDAKITPQIEVLEVARLSQSGSARIRDAADIRTPRALEQQAAEISFALEPNSSVSPSLAGGITLESDAVIDLTPASVVNFTAPTAININGRINTPAGRIIAAITTPPSSLDQGFDPRSGIRVGGAAVLNARGAIRTEELVAGANIAPPQLLDGGTISLSAARGSVELQQGSVLDVSGAVGEIIVPAASGTNITSRTVATEGGTIRLVAPENILIDGDLVGRGWSNAKGSDVAGGSLEIALSRISSGFIADPTSIATYPDVDRRILVAAADATPSAAAGTVLIADDLATAGGFANLKLEADNRIEFAGNADLQVANRLELRAGNLSAADGQTINVRANYVALGPQSRVTPAPQAAEGGTASLNVKAGLIDLGGNLATQGFGQIHLNSAGDLRMSGLAYTDGLSGSLSVGGNLDLTASQFYPSSYSRYLLESVAPAGRIRFAANGNSPAAPFSAAGSLTVRADRIVQGGRIAAPLGKIELAANSLLEMLPGSVTTTSAGRDILFGQVQGSSDWVYETRDGVFEKITAPVDKQVALSGASVQISEGATVDISGGGDLLAYEFIPGPGGSIDVLDPANSNGRYYAIIPTLGSGSAPLDTQEFRGTDLNPGDTLTVYADVPGLLSAGKYTLLPARYALLPGAVLIEALPGSNFKPGTLASLADGTRVVAGARSVAGLDTADALAGNFAIRKGSYSQDLGEYQLSRGNEFFPRAAAAQDRLAPRVARDAGRLSVTVGDSLSLDGDFIVNAAPGGRGSRADIAADRLLISDGASGSTAGFVEISVEQLAVLEAESLLLGGTRSSVIDGSLFDLDRKTELREKLITLSDGTELALDNGVLIALDKQTVIATQDLNIVTFAADELVLAESALLAGKEVLLGASGSVTLANGSRLASTAAQTSGSERILLLDADTTRNAGGTLARVSGAPQIDVLRRKDAAGAGEFLAGQDASIAASGSATISAAGSARSFGSFAVDGGSLSLGSNRIVLGADQNLIADGLALSNAALADFSQLAELRLVSRQGINIESPVTLNGNSGQRLARLVLDSPSLTGNGVNALFAADTLVLTNSSGTALPTAQSAGGVLNLQARDLLFGSGDLLVDGFATLAIDAERQVKATDQFALQSTADVELTAPLLSGAAGTELTLAAAGKRVALLRPANTDQAQVNALAAGAGLGAALTLSAADVTVDTQLAFPSGAVSLLADNSLTLLDESSIDVAGRTVSFPGKNIVTPGGDVLLRAGGDVNVAAGASIDLSGAGETAAGSLAVRGKNVSLGGQLLAQATQSEDGGWFKVVAETITGFGTLLNKLAAGGFTGSQQFETTTGNLSLAANQRIDAHEVVIAASGGSLNVAGTVNAAGKDGGRIVLAARDDLVLASGAQLTARADASDSDGGDVRLGTQQGSIVLADQAAIDVTGGALSEGGSVQLRAPAVVDSMALTLLPGTGGAPATLAQYISGAAEVILEPFQVFNVGDLIDATVQDTVQSALSAFMLGAGNTIATQFGIAGDPVYAIRPGAELRSTGDLTLASNWDLAGQRYAGQSGMLTIRSAGDLNFNAGLLDGFVVSGVGAQAKLLQTEGPSWSYTAVAGADIGSALPWATTSRGLASGATGSLRLSDAADIRTGTGDIVLAANRDIELLGPKASIYTSGVAARPSEQVGFGLLISTKNWAKDGGDITLLADRDVIGANVNQFLSGWTVRSGGSAAVTDWAVDFDVFERVGFQQVLAESFNQGIGTLAGGDITLRAGRDLDSVFATVNSTGRETAPDSNVFETWGGGDLQVHAGRDVRGGGYANFAGDSAVYAGRSLIGGAQIGATTLHTLLAHGNGAFAVVARSRLELESSLNPASIAPTNLTGRVLFFDSAANDSLSLLSVGGDISLYNQPSALIVLAGREVANASAGFALFPGTFGAYAPSGDINIVSNFGMLPAPTGNLDLIARGSVRTDNPVIAISMSDNGPGAVPSRVNPFTSPLEARQAVGDNAAAAIHKGDAQPVRLVALEGDIDGGIYALPKQAFVYAGRDVRDVRLQAQNTDPGQVTLVQAGRDITLDDSGAAIEVGGPGSLQVIAGRNINLGLSRGITTIGNTRNANLGFPDGADISLYVGMKSAPRFDEFAKAYLFDTDIYKKELIRFVEQQSGQTGLTLAAARDYFADLTTGEQLPLLNAVFFAELAQSGRDAVDLLASPDPLDDFAALLVKAGVDPDEIGLGNGVLDSLDKLGIAQLYWRGVKAADTLFGLPVISGEDNVSAFITGVAGLDPSISAADVLNLLLETNRVYSTADSRSITLPFYAGFTDGVTELVTQRNPGLSTEDLQQRLTGIEDGILGLLPEAPYAGDLNMAFSQVYTISGGDIDIFTPGGLVNVGLANPPANTTLNKKPSELGIVAQGAGDVRMYTDGDVLVNQSRVFTLGGGDIVLWASNGDIDAGRGAKSSISAPEPVITVDQDGQIQVEFADAIAGSGIRGILTNEDIKPGDVVLVAPTGDVNAGDAGIGSAGDALIAARRCIGCDNINISGSIASPVVDTSGGLTGGLGAAASVTASATKAAESAAGTDTGKDSGSTAESALGWLEVFVDGFGEEDDEDDEEDSKDDSATEST